MGKQGERSGSRGRPHTGWWLSLLCAGLAACGSGGTDTGGGGNGGDGGGTRRGGGFGNNLTLTPTFLVRNHANVARTETVRASVPFTRGMVPSLATVGVRGIQAAWLPLQYWPDGSVRIAQAQFTDTLAANETRTYEVVRDVQPLSGPFVRNEWVTSAGANLLFGARVRDTFGVAYEATTSGAGEVVQESYLVRCVRHRVYHTAASGGIGRDYLTSTFYVYEFRDMPFVTVDWVLGNDYLGTDDPGSSQDRNLRPLLAVDVNEATFRVRGATEAKAERPDWHAVGAEVAEGGGWRAFRVMSNTWIDDGQTRRYRFHVRIENPAGAEPAKLQWRTTFGAFHTEPLMPLADLATWQGTGALGLHGGPVTGPSNAKERATSEWNEWRGRNHFGTFATFGDVQGTATTGTPRNAPVSPELVRAIQGQEPRLLTVLEQKAWAQAMRPYHLYGLQVGAEQAIQLWDAPPLFQGGRDLSPESLGRRAVLRNDTYSAYRTRVVPNHDAHGWNWYDHEHWSTDLVFDYWSVTGDAWAKEELRLLGECLKGLMRLKTYFTSGIQAARAEGWCMTGFVHVYLATGDPSVKSYAQRRIREIVEAQRRKDHPSKAMMMQGSYAGTQFGPNHTFMMPWQHGPVVYGFLSAAVFFDDEVAMKIAEDVVTTVEYSWVTNHQDPRYGLVANGLRYYVPITVDGQPVPPSRFDSDPSVGVRWGDSPLGGAHSFLTAALLLLADKSDDPVVQTKAERYGRLLLGPLDDNARWFKWNSTINEELLR